MRPAPPFPDSLFLQNHETLLPSHRDRVRHDSALFRRLARMARAHDGWSRGCGTKTAGEMERG